MRIAGPRYIGLDELRSLEIILGYMAGRSNGTVHEDG